MTSLITAKTYSPEFNWVPTSALTYLVHTAIGESIRSIARSKGCHPSTILRQVQKYEMMRDDPLVDEALNNLSNLLCSSKSDPRKLEHLDMDNSNKPTVLTDENITKEARRILRRLCETGAYLVVAPHIDSAVVFKDNAHGGQTKIALVDQIYAQAFALREWIDGEQLGKVSRYTITNTGRAALKRILEEDRQAKLSENSNTPFQEQHKVFGERMVNKYDKIGTKSLRFNLAESPLTLLARKKDKSGAMFLSPELLEAGERLREDFEQAQLGPRVTQNWDRFLTNSGSGWNGSNELSGSSNARERVAAAMKALGPGLADVALRVCCFLEGLEKAERRLGWAARSGKVVLKIALQRLADHYGIPSPEHRNAS